MVQLSLLTVISFIIVVILLVVRLVFVAQQREFKTVIFKHFDKRVPLLLISRVKSVSISHSNILGASVFKTFTDGYYSHWALVVTTTDDKTIMLTTRGTESVIVHNIDSKTIKPVLNNKRYVKYKDADGWEYIINTSTIVNISKQNLQLHNIVEQCYQLVSTIPYSSFKVDCQYIIGRLYNNLTPKNKHMRIITNRVEKICTAIYEIVNESRFTYSPKLPVIN